MGIKLSGRRRYAAPLFIVAASLVVFFAMAFYYANRTFSPAENVLGLKFQISAVALGFLLTLISAWWFRRRGKIDIFELPVWFSINVYVQVILNVLLLYRGEESLIPWLQQDYDSKMSVAVWIFGFGLIAMWLGYVWMYRNMGRRGAHFKTNPENVKFPVTVAIWMACDMAAPLVMVLKGLGGVYGSVFLSSPWYNYFFLVQILGMSAWTVLSICHFRNPKPLGWLWFIGTIIIKVVFGLLLGTRSIVLLFLWTAMLIYYATGKINWRWLAMGVVFALIFVPVVVTFRAETDDITDVANPLNRLGSMTYSFKHVLKTSFYDTSKDFIEIFKRRQGILLEVVASVAVLHHDSKTFIFKDWMTSAAQQLVPRFIWLNKPVARNELYRITEVYTAVDNTGSFTSISMFGDGYRIGGWPFLILLFIGIGAFSAWVYQKGPGAGSLSGTVIYFLVLTRFLTYDKDLLPFLTQSVYMLPILYIAVRYVMIVVARSENA